jgi:hypothetical protein
LRFEATALAGLQIKGVLFGVGDNAFAGDGALEATDGAFDTLVIVNLYSSHSKPPETHNRFAMPPGGFVEAVIATRDYERERISL